jgi:hypothetical protein
VVKKMVTRARTATKGCEQVYQVELCQTAQFRASPWASGLRYERSKASTLILLCSFSSEILLLFLSAGNLALEKEPFWPSEQVDVLLFLSMRYTL